MQMHAVVCGAGR